MLKSTLLFISKNSILRWPIFYKYLELYVLKNWNLSFHIYNFSTSVADRSHQNLRTFRAGDRMTSMSLLAPSLPTVQCAATLICIVCVVSGHCINYQGKATAHGIRTWDSHTKSIFIKQHISLTLPQLIRNATSSSLIPKSAQERIFASLVKHSPANNN